MSNNINDVLYQSVMFNEPCKQLRSGVDSQGTKANRSGKTAEDTIYCVFKERGYAVHRQVVIGHSIYGYPVKSDFYIMGLSDYKDGLIVESKWQASSGSVDEKYPYLVMNIKERYPQPTIIVIDGDGMRPGALEWLRRQVDGASLIGVYSLVELLKWVIENEY